MNPYKTKTQLFTLLFSLLFPTFTLHASQGADVKNTPDKVVEEQAAVIARGQELLNSGRMLQAVKYWREIYREYRSDKRIASLALYSAAVAEFSLGHAAIANNALKIATGNIDEGDLVLRLQAYHLLAKTQIALGNLDSALESANMAYALAVKLADSSSKVKIQLSLGKIHLLRGNANYAAKFYAAAEERGKSITDTQLSAEIYEERIRFALSAQDYTAMSELFRSVVPVLERGKSRILTSLHVPRLIDLLTYIPVQAWPELQASFIKANDWLALVAMDERNQHNYMLRSYATGLRGLIYSKAGDNKQAEMLVDKAINLAQIAGSNALLARWFGLQAEILKIQGDTVNAMRAYRLALENFEPIKSEYVGLPNEEMPEFLSREHNVYLGLADLMLRKARREEDPGLKQGLLRNARDVVEKQKTVELQNYFKDRCVAEAEEQTTLIDRLISDKTAVVYPILLEDRLEFLVSIAGKIHQFVTLRSYAEIKENVDILRSQLVDIKSRDYLDAAKKLYSWVISPYEALLQSNRVDSLVIVAESVLRTVPLAVLYNGDQYLIERYAIALSPGLSLTDPKPLPKQDLHVLLSGISESVQGFPALPYVRGELEEIQDMFVARLLLNRDFITQNFQQALHDESYAVAHVASHSEFSGHSEDSYILTFDGKISLDQLSQITSRAKQNRHPIELLTLSACQTAAGDDKAALGLAGIAVKSGARSALATLWAIDDYASSLLVSEFYRQLRDNGESKARALQHAQTKLIHSRRFGHPAYWSPFLLIGNWL